MLRSGFRMLPHLILTIAQGPDRKRIIIGPNIVMILAKNYPMSKKSRTLFLTFHLMPVAICLASPITASANGNLRPVISQGNGPQGPEPALS